MSAELKVLIFVAATLGFAYVAVYPRLKQKSLTRMMQIDLLLSVMMLACVGAVYAGTATPFSMVLFHTPWWLFTLICAAIVEAPLFWWFCKRWDIDLRWPSEDE